MLNGDSKLNVLFARLECSRFNVFDKQKTNGLLV